MADCEHEWSASRGRWHECVKGCGAKMPAGFPDCIGCHYVSTGEFVRLPDCPYHGSPNSGGTEHENMKVEMGGRGSGKTTRAMLAAPKDAVFIWCNHHLDYLKRLVKHLGRDDLRIVSPEWIEDERWAGMDLTALVRDPDTELTERQREKLHAASTRVRSTPSGGSEHG